MGRNGEWATGRFGVWAMANDRERLKTGAAVQRELHSRHAEFSPYQSSASVSRSRCWPY